MIGNQVLIKNANYYSVGCDHFLRWCEFVLEKQYNIKEKLKFEDVGECWLAVAHRHATRLEIERGGEVSFFATKMFKNEYDILHGEVIYEIGDNPMEVYDVNYILSILKDGFEFSDEYESFLVYEKIQ
jgi:hypothetical protein